MGRSILNAISESMASILHDHLDSNDEDEHSNAIKKEFKSISKLPSILINSSIKALQNRRRLSVKPGTGPAFNLIANRSVTLGPGQNGDTSEDDFLYLHGEEYSDARSFERILSIVVPVIFGLIVITGLIGNSLVVLVVMRKRQFRSATNLLIGNLAIADLSFLLICVPFTGTQYALAQWPFSDTWCRFVQYMINVCAYASVYTLVSMSVIRYIVVVYPMHSMYLCTLSRTFRVIAAIWTGSILLNVPVLFLFQKYEYEFGGQSRSACIMLDGSPQLPRIFYSLFFVATFVAPLSAICILYVILLRALWDKTPATSAFGALTVNNSNVKTGMSSLLVPNQPRGWRRGKKGSNQGGASISSTDTMGSQYHHGEIMLGDKSLTTDYYAKSSFSGELIGGDRVSKGNSCKPGTLLTKSEAGAGSHLKNKKKVTKLTVIVVVVFAACWLPIHIMLLVQYFASREFGPAFQPTLVAANCLAYMNSCVNPILYSFLSRSFYQAFLELLCPGLAKRNRKKKMVCNKNRYQKKDRHRSSGSPATLHNKPRGGHLTTIHSGLPLAKMGSTKIASTLPDKSPNGSPRNRADETGSVWSGSDDLTNTTGMTSRYITAEGDDTEFMLNEYKVKYVGHKPTLRSISNNNGALTTSSTPRKSMVRPKFSQMSLTATSTASKRPPPKIFTFSFRESEKIAPPIPTINHPIVPVGALKMSSQSDQQTPLTPTSPPPFWGQLRRMSNSSAKSVPDNPDPDLDTVFEDPTYDDLKLSQCNKFLIDSYQPEPERSKSIIRGGYLESTI